MKVRKLFEEGHTITWSYLKELEWPWEALSQIQTYIEELGPTLDTSEFDAHPNNVWIHKSATVAPSAHIGSFIIIDADAEIRHSAFIRKDAIIGKNAVVGNSTELKNVILFDSVQVPHFNYVGDSILGYKAHLGAGVITSNVKNDHTLVKVTCGVDRIDTGLKKFGAILGDHVEVGCNSVLNPGTVIGPSTDIYPLSMVRGFVPAGCIYKTQGEIVKKT